MLIQLRRLGHVDKQNFNRLFAPNLLQKVTFGDLDATAERGDIFLKGCPETSSRLDLGKRSNVKGSHFVRVNNKSVKGVDGHLASRCSLIPCQPLGQSHG